MKITILLHLFCWIIILPSCETIDEPTQNPLIISPTKETVIEDLKRPWSMIFLSGEEVLLTEKDGNLLRINLETKSKTIINGLPDDLADTITITSSQHPFGTYPKNNDGFRGKYNAGLFEILLDPDFENNHWVYLSYVAQNENGFTTKVIRAVLQNNTLLQIQTLLVATPFSEGLFHFGGGMTFGSDGKLYITIGERLFNEVLEPDLPIAQDLQDRRGKIYRINPDGSIPDDNPFFGEQAVAGLYAIGIRAAQGITVSPTDGKIWFSEHGTKQGDEINVLEAGANYGWPIVTTGGYRASDYDPPTLDASFTDPIWYWLQTVAPTGLIFYTGDEFPQWKNDLFVSGLSRGSLWRLKMKGEMIKSVEELFVDDRVRARKIVQSPTGRIYLLTDEVNGRIIRISNEEK